MSRLVPASAEPSVHKIQPTTLLLIIVVIVIIIAIVIIIIGQLAAVLIMTAASSHPRLIGLQGHQWVGRTTDGRWAVPRKYVGRSRIKYQNQR